MWNLKFQPNHFPSRFWRKVEYMFLIKNIYLKNITNPSRSVMKTKSISTSRSISATDVRTQMLATWIDNVKNDGSFTTWCTFAPGTNLHSTVSHENAFVGCAFVIFAVLEPFELQLSTFTKHSFVCARHLTLKEGQFWKPIFRRPMFVGVNDFMYLDSWSLVQRKCSHPI